MNRIKQLRNKMEWTQERLAKELFTTQANISGWESGKWHPDIDSLKTMSRIFDVSIDYILDNQDLLERRQLQQKNINKLSKNLKSYRKLSALTQQNLVSKLHITQQAYANYENGVSEPNLQVLIELSEYYNVSLDTLVGLSENKSQTPIAPNLAKDIWLNSLTEL